MVLHAQNSIVHKGNRILFFVLLGCILFSISFTNHQDNMPRGVFFHSLVKGHAGSRFNYIKRVPNNTASKSAWRSKALVEEQTETNSSTNEYVANLPINAEFWFILTIASAVASIVFRLFNLKQVSQSISIIIPNRKLSIGKYILIQSLRI